MTQIHDALAHVRADLDHRFAGSMRWVSRNGTDYLYRKFKASEKSLGPRSLKTEEADRLFRDGRDEAKAREARLKKQLDQAAPILRASNLGRVPVITAKILRRLARDGVLGRDLIVVGTNALYAYEAHAGVQIRAGHLATGDVDLLFDARRGLRFCSEELRQEGLLRILQRVDRSFTGQGYRASNNDGFYVDLIRPESRHEVATNPADRIVDDDLVATPVLGLDWLLSVPKFEQVAVGEDGLPVPMAVIDPRAFALQKAWLARRPDRDPIKKVRDQAQSDVAAELAARYFGMDMDDPVLTGLPKALR
ncbi:nucleotidyltransferase domain-containing protein [Magnetospira sp. QH-2]|uniref:GSU2403 family nucleotidyltransferase fold protein n=1 Tax=Magnetospira sp. (strain QH-2) TaxID=1288970 RepID=UPI00130DF3A3|nr:nucleotidyltransferase domain-containing protein [Magnetospira sp. QH-2]